LTKLPVGVIIESSNKEGFMATPNNQPSGWVGWVYFAGIMLVVRAIFTAFEGIVALTHSSFYVVTPHQLAVYNFTAWGWIDLVLAAVMLFAGFSVLSGHLFGRIVAIVVATVSLLASLVFLPAYPVWGLAAIALDAVIIYALVAHGAEAGN
jgi:hypothetical protein